MDGNDVVPQGDFSANKWLIGAVIMLSLLLASSILVLSKTPVEKEKDNMESNTRNTTKTTLTYNEASFIQDYTDLYGADSPPTTAPAKNAVRKYNITLDTCMSLSGVESIYCFSELSVVAKDVKYCDNILDEGLKDTCIRHYGVNVTNASVCDVYLGNTQKYMACYLEATAFSRNDPGFIRCAALPNDKPPYLRSMCIFDDILLGNNFTAADCLQIGQKDIRTYCIAVMQRNRTMCNDLADDAWQKDALVGACTGCSNATSRLKCRLMIDNKGNLRYET
jgi:hypothetical protein